MAGMRDNCFSCGQPRRDLDLDTALDQQIGATAERDSYLRARNGLCVALVGSVLVTGAAAPMSAFSTEWMIFLLVVGILGIIISTVFLVITFMSTDGLAALNDAVRTAERNYRAVLGRGTA